MKFDFILLKVNLFIILYGSKQKAKICKINNLTLKSFASVFSQFCSVKLHLRI